MSRARALARRLREPLIRAALVLISLALCLAAAEAIVRLAQPQSSPYTGRGLYQPDPDLGHVLRPDHTSGDVHTNSFGFRDREYALAKPAGTFRIVGLGDSFTFGAAFPGGIYLERLEAKLTQAGRAAEVINTGVPAYSTVQEIGHLKKFGIRFAPDLVVLGLFPTGDVVENLSDEHLEVVDGELTDRAVDGWQRWLMRSHLYRLLRARTTVHAAAPADPLALEGFLGVEFERLQICRRKPRKYIPPAYELTERLLVELRDYLKARGAALVVLLIPDEVQVSPELFQAVLAAKGGAPADYDLDLPTRRLREFCRSRSIDVVDVLEECRTQNRAEPVYKRADTHWNERGYEIAAQKLFEYVMAR